jgi:NitT/TauT family transport system substrate-binding protein
VAANRARKKGLLLSSRTSEVLLAVGLAVAIVAGAVAASSAADRRGGHEAEVPVSDAQELRLGYFANVTHAPALIGVDKGFFAEELGGTELSTQVFNAGPAAVEALNAGAIDAAFIGPNPAINSYVQSEGRSLRIVSGASSGGAQLVVREGIDNPEDLHGATLTTPQLGGTQDVALRVWLKEQGTPIAADSQAGVTINPTENAGTLQLFKDGQVDGAWVPEPWASRLVLEAGAKVLVDERDLWPEGQFTTTLLIVGTDFLNRHPEQVKALIVGEQRSVEWLNETLAADPAFVAEAINAGLEDAHGLPLTDEVVRRSLANITFTLDPHAAALAQLLEDGVTAGTTEQADISTILDLSILNGLRSREGNPAVPAAGLGKE